MRLLGVVRLYTESMGRVGDNRRQTTYAWYAQDTWKIHTDVTLDVGLRMYKSDLPRHITDESSIFTFEEFDPRWGGNPPVLYRPITTVDGRRAVNPLNGAIVPVLVHRPDRAWHRIQLRRDHADRRRASINGVVPQVNDDFVDGGVGFTDPTPVQFDPRVGLAWSAQLERPCFESLVDRSTRRTAATTARAVQPTASIASCATPTSTRISPALHR